MKTYFKVVSFVSFGHKGYEIGYCNAKMSIPEVTINKDEEFSVEFEITYENENQATLEYDSQNFTVTVSLIGRYLLKGRIRQIDFLTKVDDSSEYIPKDLWDLG